MAVVLPTSLPPKAMQTFGVVAPAKTHWRAATCAEVECPRWRNGWRTTLDTVGQAELVHTVRTSGRRPSRVLRDGPFVTFVFDPGTPCFEASTHRVRLDKPELYVVRGGDHRPDRSVPVRRHARAADWVEHFQEQNDRRITSINRG